MEQDFVEIQLSKGKFSKIDLEDRDRVGLIKWHAVCDGKNFYAACCKRKDRPSMKLHRYIMYAKKGEHVDHINGDTLDNRKENLRICKHKENLKNQRIRKNNTSGYRGVYFNKSHKKWRAQIQDGEGNRKYLGSFSTPEEAAKAYDTAAKEIYGDFAGALNYE